MPGMHSGEGFEWFAAVHDVRTARAVDMQVDEAGNDQNVIVRIGVAWHLRHEADPMLLNSDCSVTPPRSRQDVSGDRLRVHAADIKVSTKFGVAVS